MTKDRWLYCAFFLLSALVLSFEIISTRIASVIFVSDSAYIILSLAILGLAAGGIVSTYLRNQEASPFRTASRLLFLLGGSLLLFIVCVTAFSITSAVLFFPLLTFPFFLAGMVYARLYRIFAEASFKLYAADLSGAAAGSAASLGLIALLGGPNSILFLALLAGILAAVFLRLHAGSRQALAILTVLILSIGGLLTNGRNELLDRVPIGKFPEKDFYFVYPDPSVQSRIIDSRWSMYGRSDLVAYSHQDVVRQIFIDGAAGTQLYRFNGNVQRTNSNLQDLLLHHTNAIPFLCLGEDEKRSMLVIGPGGGKEVLMGLFGGVRNITGVEVNPDFVRLVRDHREFDGGIYSDFPNVTIDIEEGRHFVQQAREPFDLIVMALPSTAQMQNIEPFATSENYLLTKEALRDYFRVLAPDGKLILTVHNSWELMRLLTTAVAVFDAMGVPRGELPNHFAVLEAPYAPTVVIKKRAFTVDETMRWKIVSARLPRDFPTMTYLPYGLNLSPPSVIDHFLTGACRTEESLQTYVAAQQDDISACTDDKPYFYKMDKTVPGEFSRLLAGIAGVNILVAWLPFRFLRKEKKTGGLRQLSLPLAIFAGIGVGFMVLEISLLQKLVLYLGSPTIALSILLSSLLVGMGAGSYFSRRLQEPTLKKRISAASAFVVVAGTLLLFASPFVLEQCLHLGLVLRSLVCFVMILPLAFFLGIPFPSCIRLLKSQGRENHIPWMYGVNGSMSVLGSVLAIVLSMIFGFTFTYIVGLCIYATLATVTFVSSRVA